MVREPKPADAREALVSLTDTGRNVVADVEAAAGRVAVHAAMDADWGPDDRARLVELLDGLGAAGLPTTADG